MKVYRVYVGSYDGEYTLRCFTDSDEAIAFARAEARTTNEEFTGSIGYGVGIEVLDTETGNCDEDIEGWHDWSTKIEGSRFVLADPPD